MVATNAGAFCGEDRDFNLKFRPNGMLRSRRRGERDDDPMYVLDLRVAVPDR